MSRQKENLLRSSSKETPPDKDSSDDLLTVEKPRRTLPEESSGSHLSESNMTIVVHKVDLVEDKDRTQKLKLRDATVAQAHRLQHSLKNLVHWAPKREAEEAQAAKAKLHPPDRGSSPPDFILSLAAQWSGCQGVASFTAADLKGLVALWIVRDHAEPASWALYDPRRQTLEEQVDLDAQPEAVVGVSLTSAELPHGDIGAFLFGGKDEKDELLSDLWFYSKGPRKWKKLRCSGKTPDRRCNHAAAFSSRTNVFFVSGGEGENGKVLESAFQLVKGEWKELRAKERPAARSHHAVSAICSSNGSEQLLLFGGLVDGSDSDDLWSIDIESELKTNTWKRITDTDGRPPARRHGASPYELCVLLQAFYDDVARVVLFSSFTDMNAFDVEVSAWFEILLLSPLAAMPPHGYAVATGDPNMMFHIFASGASSNSDGLVYRVSGVCSTLDFSLLAQGLMDIRIVSSDTKRRQEELCLEVNTIRSDLQNLMTTTTSQSGRTEGLAAIWNSMVQRVDAAYREVIKTMGGAQILGIKVSELLAEVAARESQAKERTLALEKQLTVLLMRLAEADTVRAATNEERPQEEV
ncbi:kelch motif family related protein [Cyclospora cayetanensis]|uniref:Kelch motif family related protein n=1 Tax=Cyclospora cayetanensis TaxID=88456 RepID=A0A1D3D991_9EIME|nr:kelch motif family related protein [Cyclospora cayetanensis]